MQPSSRPRDHFVSLGRGGREQWAQGALLTAAQNFACVPIVWGQTIARFADSAPKTDIFWITAEILPASLTTFVPITSLCGLKKMQSLGEDERTSLGKMGPMAAPQLL